MAPSISQLITKNITQEVLRTVIVLIRICGLELEFFLRVVESLSFLTLSSTCTQPCK